MTVHDRGWRPPIAAGKTEPRGTLPAPGQPEPSLPEAGHAQAATLAGGRVDAAAAATGGVAGSRGESPPGGLPDDDTTLEGDRA